MLSLAIIILRPAVQVALRRQNIDDVKQSAAFWREPKFSNFNHRWRWIKRNHFVNTALQLINYILKSLLLSYKLKNYFEYISCLSKFRIFDKIQKLCFLPSSFNTTAILSLSRLSLYIVSRKGCSFGWPTEFKNRKEQIRPSKLQFNAMLIRTKCCWIRTRTFGSKERIPAWNLPCQS